MPPTTFLVRRLTAQAARAGYRLVRASTPTHDWTLIDAEDGEEIYSASTLDQIQHWLDS